MSLDRFAILAISFTLASVMIPALTTTLISRLSHKLAMRRSYAVKFLSTARDMPEPSLSSLDEPAIKNYLAIDEQSIMRLYSQTQEAANVAKIREEELSDDGEFAGELAVKGAKLSKKKTKAAKPNRLLNQRAIQLEHSIL